jgi:hypothetical protein
MRTKMHVSGLTLAAIIALIASGCEASRQVIIDPLTLSISNQTMLSVKLHVNSMLVDDFPPSSYVDPIDAALLPAAPWHVEARTESGRVLAAMDVAQGDVWHTPPGSDGQSGQGSKAARADLSCGRLDIWAGSPMTGPAPPLSFPPGDCLP